MPRPNAITDSFCYLFLTQRADFIPLLTIKCSLLWFFRFNSMNRHDRRVQNRQGLCQIPTETNTYQKSVLLCILNSDKFLLSYQFLRLQVPFVGTCLCGASIN